MTGIAQAFMVFGLVLAIAGLGPSGIAVAAIGFAWELYVAYSANATR